MNNLYSDIIRTLNPYTPGEQLNDKRYIKLNTNENPYPPSPNVIQAIKDNVNDMLRLYPDPESCELVEILAKKHKVSKECVFVSNGSDELLAFAFNAFFTHKRVAFPEITYSFYPVYCDLYGATAIKIPMGKNYTIDQKQLAMQRCGKVIANPNAPTGELLSNEYICKLLESDPNNLVLVDEAYLDFAQQESMARYVLDYKNLLVVRTFSKSYSLAGMRIGYAIGSKPLITALNTIKNCFNSYPLDRLAQVAAIAAIKDQSYYDRINDQVKTTRNRVKVQLEQLGCKVLPSESNFLFVSFIKYNSHDIYTKFREKGILIRQFSYIPEYVRISIGLDSDMDTLVQLAKEIMQK